jgi:hypothetical protein
MERSGCRSLLLGGEGLSHPQPREGEFHGGHGGAEPLGGGAFLLRDWLVGFTLSAAGWGVLAGVGGCGGCGGPWVREICFKVGLRARPHRLVAAQAGNGHWLVTVVKAYDGRLDGPILYRSEPLHLHI